MSVAFVDTSCLLAIAFDEPEADRIRARLVDTEILLASNLLEAEYRAALHREDVVFDEDALTWLRWVLPDRSLGPEMRRSLEAGYARGADLWHLATALYVAPRPPDLPFLTMDDRQRQIADTLGFTLPL